MSIEPNTCNLNVTGVSPIPTRPPVVILIFSVPAVLNGKSYPAFDQPKYSVPTDYVLIAVPPCALVLLFISSENNITMIIF